MVTVPAIVSRETSVLRPQPTIVGWARLDTSSGSSAAHSMARNGAVMSIYEIKCPRYGP